MKCISMNLIQRKEIRKKEIIYHAERTHISDKTQGFNTRHHPGSTWTDRRSPQDTHYFLPEKSGPQHDKQTYSQSALPLIKSDTEDML